MFNLLSDFMDYVTLENALYVVSILSILFAMYESFTKNKERFITDLKATAEDLIHAAEDKFAGTKTGEVKMEWVLNELIEIFSKRFFSKIPLIKYLLNEDNLKKIVETVLIGLNQWKRK